MRNKNQSGQTIIEACLFGVVVSLCLLLGIASLFYSASKQFMKVELYSIARSQIYGTPKLCKPSRLWPNIKGLTNHYSCPKVGTVRGTLRYKKLFTINEKVKI